MYSAELGKIVEAFQLENILPEISLEGRAVKKKEINRPALQLAGFRIYKVVVSFLIQNS